MSVLWMLAKQAQRELFGYTSSHEADCFIKIWKGRDCHIFIGHAKITKLEMNS